MPILEEEPSQFPPTLLTDWSEQDESRRWWAVYTKPRQEKALARQLVSFQVPFYLPLVARDHLFRGRRVQSYVPLFGGYIFLFGDENERVKSLTTNRILTLLPVEDQEQLVHDLGQVARLIACNAPLTVEKRLSPGDVVRVKHGPMEGLQGTILSRRAQTRLLVSVRMLQQGVSIEIDDFMLEPVR